MKDRKVILIAIAAFVLTAGALLVWYSDRAAQEVFQSGGTMSHETAEIPPTQTPTVAEPAARPLLAHELFRYITPERYYENKWDAYSYSGDFRISGMRYETGIGIFIISSRMDISGMGSDEIVYHVPSGYDRLTFDLGADSSWGFSPDNGWFCVTVYDNNNVIYTSEWQNCYFQDQVDVSVTGNAKLRVVLEASRGEGGTLNIVLGNFTLHPGGKKVIPSFLGKEIIGKEYRYADLQEDVQELAARYPELIQWDIIGVTAQGRELYCVRMGAGQKKIFLSAGTHARETLNTPLVMQTLFELAESWNTGGMLGNQDLTTLFEEISIICVPLVNPDGYEYCLQYSDGEKKTNGNNVDLNRNFPCKYWGSTLQEEGNNYPGPYPGSEAETMAIMHLFDQHTFSLAVDVHSKGRIIFCQKGGYIPEDISTGKDPLVLNTISKALADRLSREIPYQVVNELSVTAGEEGTLTDYAFSQGVPTITFETMPGYSTLPAGKYQAIGEYALLSNWPKLLCMIADFTASLDT